MGERSLGLRAAQEEVEPSPYLPSGSQTGKGIGVAGWPALQPRASGLREMERSGSPQRKSGMALIERGRVNCTGGETAGRSPTTAPPSHLSGAQPGRGKAGSLPLIQPNSALTSPSSPVQIAGAPNAPNSLEGRSRISSCETREGGRALSLLDITNTPERKYLPRGE